MSELSLVLRRPRLASRSARLVARILDPLLAAAFVLPARALGAEMLGVALWSVVAAFLLAGQGQSPGKAVLGIRIVRADGRPASFFRSTVVREGALPLLCLLGLVLAETTTPGTLERLDDATFTMIALALGVLSIAPILGHRRRGLHDYLAGTIVVNAR